MTALDRHHLRHAAHHLRQARACLAVCGTDAIEAIATEAAQSPFDVPTQEQLEALAGACWLAQDKGVQ